MEKAILAGPQVPDHELRRFLDQRCDRLIGEHRGVMQHRRVRKRLYRCYADERRQPQVDGTHLITMTAAARAYAESRCDYGFSRGYAMIRECGGGAAAALGGMTPDITGPRQCPGRGALRSFRPH